jgi:hypothetical protein
MITPNVSDNYSRYMDELFDEKEIINVSTVWQSFFGRPANSGSKTIYSPDSEVVEIDVMRANERVAALIHRGTDSRHLNLQKNTTTQNYTNFARVYPLAEELGDITATQILKKMAGENPYDQRAKAERMRLLAREHHLEHIRRYVRLFEILSGASLLTGMQPSLSLTDTNVDNWYDFRRNAAHLITPAVPWNDPAADILGDVDAGCRLLRVNGKVKPNCLFLGLNVASVFFNDTIIQNFADNRGFNIIFVNATNPAPSNLQPIVDGGATCRAQITTPEGNTFWVFTYSDVYTDDNGVAQYYMPLNSAFLAYYGARCDRYFGPSERLPILPTDRQVYQEMFGMNLDVPIIPSGVKSSGGIVDPAMFYCDAYRSNDGKKVTVRTQSAPIFATTQTDSFITFLNVLGTES